MYITTCCDNPSIRGNIAQTGSWQKAAAKGQLAANSYNHSNVSLLPGVSIPSAVYTIQLNYALEWYY